MKPRHLNCLAHFGDPPDGSIDVRESVYMYLYKEKIAREHLTGPQHYPDNGLVSGTRGKVSRNQEEEGGQTSSRWYGAEVWSWGGCQLGCRPRHLTGIQDCEVRPKIALVLLGNAALI
ncbi:hypothetical protein AVEN_55128-1 [Araneus ventricosus]|uniref:Uncharacterized protein n=1 Tax=Araneus ventricosus TaxID=182803 RepID=A0A4Y2U6W9_ARAVE|nr:hypothetical protein AVEN_164118-1 [Araneus ventricosus]GBO08438.1 hypothetical protein AVEN_55128-1 [Araneus ventricosus]